MTNSLKAILGVFLIVLSAYAFLAGGHYGGDAFNNYLTTQSLVLDRDIAIYDRPFEIKEVQTDASQGVPGKDGKRYSAYGMGMPLLQVPFFLVGMAISFFMKDLPANYVTFFCVSFTNVFLSAVNVVLLLVLLQKLGVKLKEAITLSLVYAFSTMALVYSKSGFPEPALVTFMLIAMVSLFSYVKEKKGMGYLVISGAALGFMAMIKVYTVILAPAFLVYFLSASGARRRYAWVPMIAFLAVLSVDLWANFIRSGNILVTGYGHVITQAKYGNRFLKALYYYWFSSGKGFFFYNLPLILGLFCWGQVRDRNKREFYFIVSVIMIYVVFFAYFFKRGSIFSWGPRYMFPVIPLFVVLASDVFRKKMLLRVFAGLAALGFFVQLPAVLAHYSSYINFVVESLKMPEYAINYIPDLTPIKGAWAILVSVVKTYVTGQGGSFVFNPDIMFVRPLNVPLAGYDMADLWWINLTRAYPNMTYAVVLGIIFLLFVFVLGAVKVRDGSR